ncbi:MAG: hypothetical protein LBT99_04095 [Bifidobacteriaceae bacterium]|nr:hypothetical protein [Bifidobacteriaceae bacterium]
MTKVVAFIVTNGNTAWLNKSIFSSLGQTHSIDSLYICDIAKSANALKDEQLNLFVKRSFDSRTSAQNKTRILPKVKKIKIEGTKNFSSTILKAVQQESIDTEKTLFWLLHDDSAAYPDTLAKQLKQFKDGVGIVGCKQLFWKTKKLLEVGYSITPSGKRVDLIWPGEIDQGQHDETLEVFGVSLAGALIDAKLFISIVALRSFYSIYNESTDFCNKVHLSGHKVIVATSAKLNHIGASYREQRGKLKSWHIINSAAFYRFSNTSGFYILPLFLYYILAAPFKTARSFILKQPATALSEFVLPLTLLAYMPFILRQRLKLKALNNQFSNKKVLSFNKLFTNYSTSRVVQKEQKAYYRGALTSEALQPTPLEEARLQKVNKMRRITLAFLIALLCGLTFVLFGSDIMKIFSGGYFMGKGLSTSGANLSQLWQAATTNWVSFGQGYNMPGNPVLFLLIPLTFLCNGSLQLVLNLGFILAVLLASLGAWAAAGVITRQNSWRFLAALLWGFCPTLIISIQQGHFQTILAWIAIPVLFYSIIRAYGLGVRDFRQLREFNWPSFACASLMLAVIVATLPVLCLIILIIIILCVRHIGGRRRHLLALFLPSAIIISPLVFQIIRHPSFISIRALFSDSATNYSYGQPGVWQAILGLPTPKSFQTTHFNNLLSSVHISLIFDIASLALVSLIAILALYVLICHIRVRYAYMSWIILLLSIIVSALTSKIVVGVFDNNSLYGWTASSSGITIFVLLCLALTLSGKKFPFSILTVVAICFMFLAGVNIFTSGDGIINNLSQNNNVPAVGVQEQDKNSNMRVLEITTNPDGTYNYAILRKANQEFVDISGYVNVDRAFANKDENSQILEKAIATMVTQPSNVNIDNLIKYNIRGILVPASEAKSTYYENLVSQINTVSGLQRVIIGQETVYWRVGQNMASPVIPEEQARANNSFISFIWKLVASFVIIAYLLMMVPVATIRKFLS